MCVCVCVCVCANQVYSLLKWLKSFQVHMLTADTT